MAMMRLLARRYKLVEITIRGGVRERPLLELWKQEKRAFLQMTYSEEKRHFAGNRNGWTR